MVSDLIVQVCKVDKVEHHPNADRLDVATIKGWECIVGRDQFVPGDLIVYVPPDSVMPGPMIERYNLTYLKKNGRVGAVKLRGVVSQGLVLEIPTDLIPSYYEGYDVAEKLGIIKWEPPVRQGGFNRGRRQPTKKKANPHFDRYTDIQNIRNFNTAFEEGEHVVITEKIHGTNFRAGRLPRFKGTPWGRLMALLFGKFEFVYGSHNVQLLPFRKKNFYGEDVYGRIAKRFDLANKIPDGYIVYGEIYGPGIQDLTYAAEDIQVVFFDVKRDGQYLNWLEAYRFFVGIGLPTVPLIYEGPYSVEDLEVATNGKSLLAPTQIREGCVVRSAREVRFGHMRKVLKSINPEYLIRKGGTEDH
jgi:RNA ligase (TIGR02306 family)